jgi:hypothetical protein
MDEFEITLAEVDEIVTDAVVDEYWERGYWRSPKLLSDVLIARLRQAHDRLWAGDFDHEIPSNYGPPKPQAHPADLRQQCNAFWLNDAIRAVVTSPVIGKIGAKLMRVDTVRLWHDQAIAKPGRIEGVSTDGARPNVGWHQDYGHWTCADDTNMCTAWMALQDTDSSQRRHADHHRLPPLGSHPREQQVPVAGAGGRRRPVRGRRQGEWVDEPCILRAGEVSFHHALTFHGSGANTSAETRLSVVSHMMPGGTRYGPVSCAIRTWSSSAAGPRRPGLRGPYFPRCGRRRPPRASSARQPELHRRPASRD